MNGKAALKIAHLSPTYFSKNSVIGGGERYVNNVVKALQRASRREDVSIQQSVLSIGLDDESYVDDSVQVKIYKNTSPFPGNMDGFSERFWEELDGVDLVHIHQSLTFFGAYATAIARSKGIPIVSTDLGGGANELMLSGKGLELSAGVLSISKYAESLIGANYLGLHSSVIGPVDTEFFKPGSNVRRKDLAICVSRLLPHKGIDRIVRALPSELQLVIVGQIYDQRYLDLLVDLSVGKNITFIHDANDDRLVELYRSAGVFLQGSTHKDIFGNIIRKPELMGLTTLEAMACGLPAIISDAGSLPELVPDRRFGLTFSTEDELRIAFQRYVAGEWPDARFADLARSFVVENFSYDNVGRSILGFYHDALTVCKTGESTQ